MTNPVVLLHVGTGGTVTTASTGDAYIQNDLEVDGTLYAAAQTSTGNLTVNKADPSVILDVTTATDTDFWLGVQDDAGSDDDDIFVIGDGTTPGTNNFFAINTSGNVGIGTTSPVGLLQVGTSPGAGLVVTAGGLVGIGTTGPDGRLEVARSVAGFSANAHLKIYNANEVDGDYAGALFDSRSVAGGGKGYLGVVRTGDFGRQDFVFLLDNTQDDSTVTSADEVMRITKTGNVGIGTTGPQSFISGFTRVLDIGGATVPGLAFHSSNTAQQSSLVTDGAGLYVDVAGHATAASNFILFRTEETNSQYTPTERMRIDSAGNVGIGTASPVGLLQVGTSPGAGLLVTAGGLVGIGTTGPGYKLDVIGTLHASGNVNIGTDSVAYSKLRIRTPTSSNLGLATEIGVTLTGETDNPAIGHLAQIGFGTPNAYQPIVISSVMTSVAAYSIQDLFFATRAASTDTAPTERMRITSAGNVGIGTTSPLVKLSVVGGRIAQDTWTADGDTAVQYDTVTNALGIATSDRRLKKDFQPLEGALEKALRLNGLLYRDNDQPDTDKKKLGVIAQDVLEVCPEAVFEYKNEKGETYYGVHYERLTVILIEAIKQQQLEIEGLKQAVNRLKVKL